MAFIVAINRKAGIPRAYNIPTVIELAVADASENLEPYLVSDASRVVENVMEHNSKDELIENCGKIGLATNPDMNKLDIATLLADKLVEGLNLDMVKVEIYFENEEGTWSGNHEIDPNTNFHEEMAKHTEGMDTKTLVYEVERVKSDDDDASFNFDPILDGKNIPLTASFKQAVGLPVHFISIHPKFGEEKKEEKNFLLVVKCEHWTHHLLLRCNMYDTIMSVKMAVMRGQIGDDDFMNADDEQDVMTVASLMEVWMPNGSEKLDDFSCLREHFDCDAVGGTVEFKMQEDPSKLPEMMLMFLNTGAMKKAVEDGTIYNGKVVNLAPVPADKKKGRMTIKLNHIDLFYDFTETSTINDAYQALDKSGIYCTGFNGIFRLKYVSSPSLLYTYQPIYAEFGVNPVFELVATLRGGGLVRKKHLKLTTHTKTPFDQQSFQRLYATMEQVKRQSALSLKDFLNNLKLEDLKNYEHYLTHNKAGNASKVQALAQLNADVLLVEDFITELTAMKKRMEELVVKSATDACSSDGDFKMNQFKKCVEVAIGVKEELAKNADQKMD